MKRRSPQLIAEVVERLALGATVQELALQFEMSEAVVRSYKSGRRGNGVVGRPRKLSAAQEWVCLRCWAAGEANIYELASIYEVTPQTIRNAIGRRQRDDEALAQVFG